jgi:tetratricopeptide (TPR) repeat protein
MLANLALVLGLALSPLAAYNQGNQLYAHKDYAGAAAAYQEALAAAPSAAVHYNLGNALFKAGHIGQAILHYRRAHALDPADADIVANLDFARSYRADKGLADSGPAARALDVVFRRLSWRAASELAALAFAVASLLLALWIVSRRRALAFAASLCALVALYGLVVQQVWAGEVGARPAVIVVPEVSALSGPGPEFKQILLAHEGTEVRIRETRGDYLLVQLPGGSGGWLRKDAVERVYP